MQRLRLKVDRIDLKILQLLQQRIKLSTRIGQVKRRHGAAIYVPQREGELRARVTGISRGKLPPQAVDAIYREIFSNSRAVQGQAPIGLLSSSAGEIAAPARWHFGACDKFVVEKTWPELAVGIKSGSLTLGLLTGEDLANILKSTPARQHFVTHFEVMGDFTQGLEMDVPLAERILVVMARNQGVTVPVNQALILIECKSTQNAVKKLANSMSNRPISAEELSIRKPSSALVRLTLPKRVDAAQLLDRMLVAGESLDIQISSLGVYPGTENYGG
jgi:chorismate mutase